MQGVWRGSWKGLCGGSVFPSHRVCASFAITPARHKKTSTRKTKPPKVVPTLDDLLAQGLVRSGSSVPSPTTQGGSSSSPKSKKRSRTVDQPAATPDQNSSAEKSPDPGDNIEWIGKCIQYTNAGSRYTTWLKTHQSALENLSQLSRAELRYLVSQAAHDLFGYDTLRPLQSEAIMELIRPAKKPVELIVVAGTGAGKSLIIWLSAMLQDLSPTASPTLTVVVTPLVSLLQDQFSLLQPSGIPVALYYGKVSAPSRKALFERVKSGQLRMLYTTPEKAVSRQFITLLAEMSENTTIHMAIDEAHCISEWGHDFRPQYMNLGKLRAKIPALSLLCTTATATPATVMDIRKTLSIPHAALLKGKLTRENLSYHVLEKGPHYQNDILECIREEDSGSSGIVYCLTRAEADALQSRLEEEGVSCATYHSGMAESKRTQVQTAWKANQIQVVVATVAFGMGVDKPDVRFVIHSCIPTSLEAYYQQAGRAGRDGLPARCLLFFQDKDRVMASHVINAALEDPIESGPLTDALSSPSSYVDRKREQLDDMIAYAHNRRQCRQVQLLEFFHEPVPTLYECQRCDVCVAEQTAQQKKE